METIKQNCNIVLLKADNIKKRENEMKKIHSICQTKSMPPGVSHFLSNMESKENTRYLKFSPPHRNQDLFFENVKNKTYGDHYQQNGSIENIQESTIFVDSLDIIDSDIYKMQFTNNENTTTNRASVNKNKETSKDDMPVDDRAIDIKSLTYSQGNDDLAIPYPSNDLVDEKYGNEDEKTDAQAKRKRSNSYEIFL